MIEEAQTTPKGRKNRATREDIHASIVWGKHAERQKTADGAAWKQNMCQKQGEMQTAWQDAISEAKLTPSKVKKQRFQSRKREGLNASLVGGKTCKRQNTAGGAAYSKKACQKHRATQTASEGVISGTKMTPNRVNKTRFPEAEREGLNASLVGG